MNAPITFWDKPVEGEVLPPINTKRIFTAALRQRVETYPHELEMAVGALLVRAGAGDVNAIREIADRLEGKAIATVEAKVEATFKLTRDDENI